MNDLKRQVLYARRRLVVQQFLSVAVWLAFASLVVAAFGIATRKIWPIEADGRTWEWAWIGCSLLAGLLGAVVSTAWRRKGSLDAAIEIDQRFGLKERVSSCLALSSGERQTVAGQALVNDAVRRVAEINVKDKFRISPSRWACLPAAMAVVVFGLTFLSDAQPEKSQADAAIQPLTRQIKKSSRNLKQKIAERKKRAAEEGLKDATDLFKKLETEIEQLANKDKLEKKDAFVKLNDLAQEIKKRQGEIGDANQLRRQLSQLKDVQQGPADKLAKALQNNDFQAAMDAVKDLQKQMSGGEMSQEQKQKLQEQLGQLKQKLQEMVDAQNQMKQDLERQIQQRMSQGDRTAAAELQKKLDEMNRQDPAMQKIQQMAQKLGACQQCMENGDAQQAAQQLSELADSIEAVAQELDEMELLDDALQQIADARDAMNCEACNGEGCSLCQGMGNSFGNGFSERLGGMGLGQGRGQGDRPEEESVTDFYDSQVQAKPGKGRAVVIGSARGPNKAGETLEEIKAEIESATRADDDPLTGVRLPKVQRELTKEYFDKFRTGK
jgi:hypothetical protein